MRVLVVSHPAVVDVNQQVYLELVRRGFHLSLVVPDRWRHDYSSVDISPRALPGLEQALMPVPIVMPGREQRHLYLTRCGALCDRLRPDVAFLEAEPYALAATQWGRALARRGIPFGVQCYENIDRPLPLPIRALRRRVLRDADFVAARSQTAAELVRAWGARGEVAIVPPAVPGWADAPGRGQRDGRAPFRVGYAGRLIESKGLVDLLEAVRRLPAPVELLLFGAGELRGALEGQEVPGSRVRVLDGFSHDEMAGAYAQLDVLVLPSRTTPTWKEQFGRVLIEAAWCGVPVIGSDSGEIPWVIGLTGGGLVFPEGDVGELAARLQELRADPAERARLGESGREAVARLFTVAAATDPLEVLLRGAVERAQPGSAARRL